MECNILNCDKCKELLSLLKDIKGLMDSEQYMDDYDSIYDRIVQALTMQVSNKSNSIQ